MTTRQLPLVFDPRPIPIGDPKVRPEARPRLIRSTRRVLDLLRRGRVSSSEVVGICLHYNAAIYRLRKAGCAITTEHNHRTGATIYELTFEPEGLT